MKAENMIKLLWKITLFGSVVLLLLGITIMVYAPAMLKFPGVAVVVAAAASCRELSKEKAEDK